MNDITSTRHFWLSTAQVLTPGLVVKIFKMSHRQLYRWCANPKTNEQTSKNPYDHILNICNCLLEKNRPDVVEAGFRLLLEPLGYSLVKEQCESDKGSIALELLDIGKETGALINAYQKANENQDISKDEQAAMLSQADALITEVRQLKDAIKRGQEVTASDKRRGAAANE